MGLLAAARPGRLRWPRPIMYEGFAQLDGSHPWRQVSPDGYQDYQARIRPGGRVIYFNYALALELGLLAPGHPARMNAALEKVVLDTFALQIINEYDLAHPRTWTNARLKPGKYMATRYLQIQHKSRVGRTSGDGRAIWNGVVHTPAMTFDVSSRGTGATCLCPGAQLVDRPLRTGDERVGYGSGTAELDEMLGTAVMSEIFYRRGYPTERTLAVIGFDDGTAIGVRTAPNLVRPAHLFRYLKQGRHPELRAAFDYFLDRQERNGVWKLPAKPADRYRTALQYLARSYGRMAAVLEEEYVFTWLSWDGDNVLASGAIIDYGSVRQFAAKHDKYRYDDVDRWSTCLSEQRHWARQLVKVFAQGAHLAMTGRKNNLHAFDGAPCLKLYDEAFNEERDKRLLFRLGFTAAQAQRLLRGARREINDFRRALVFFEDLKIAKGVEQLGDGITHRPVFLIRNLLRTLPAYFLDQYEGGLNQGGEGEHKVRPYAGGGEGEPAVKTQRRGMMPAETFCRIMAASYCAPVDTRITPARAARVRNFQACYQRLIGRAGRYLPVLRTVCRRSAVINFEHRMTGDASVHIVNHVIASQDRLSRPQLQDALDRFIESQVLVPGQWKPINRRELDRPSPKSRLLRKLVRELDACKETV